jgi:hypothetical protein
LYARIRDIEDDKGRCIRVSVAPHPAGVLVGLERRDQPHKPSILLSLYGAEILAGFLMSARLSLPNPMPDEATEGPFSARFHLVCQPEARIVVEQEDSFPLSIDAPLWDRLFAELCLVNAHGRERVRRADISVH